MEKTVRRSNITTLEHFWEYFAFIANSIIFLLLGLTEFHIIRSGEKIHHLVAMILCVIPVVVVARLACVYVLMPLYNAFVKEIKDKIPHGYQVILFWGGLRGAVPVALVLAIPPEVPHRILIIQFTFAFIMFTLLFQGTTIKWLMGRLGIRPEANEFGDRPVERHEFNFKNDKLGALVAQSLREMFDDEAFFVRDKSSSEGVAFLAQRGGIMFLASQEEEKVAVVCEKENVGYVKHLLYETLLHLNDAVKDMRDVAEHDKISDLVLGAKRSEFKIPFNVMKHLSKKRMLVGVQAGRKEEVVESLVRRLVDNGDIEPDDFLPVLDLVLKREESMTTALGDNVAIPHARKCEFVKNLTALVATAPEGIDFDAVDGKPVKIFILLLSPVDAVEPHVQFMAAMGKLLIDSCNREAIALSRDTDELYANIERIARERAG